MTRLLTVLLLLAPLFQAAAAQAPSASDWQRIANRLQQGDRHAVTLAQQVQNIYPQWPGSYVALADYHLDAGLQLNTDGDGQQAAAEDQFRQALQQANRARELLPDQVKPIAQIMRAMLQLKRYEDCWSLFGTFAQRDSSGLLHLLASRAQLELGNLSQAGELAKKALEQADSVLKPHVFILQARIATLDNRLRDAENLMEKACQAAPNQAACWFNLALVRRRLQVNYPGVDAISQALESIQRALDLAPEDGAVALAAGMIAAEAGQLETATHHLQRARQLLPHTPLPELALAGVLLDLGTSTQQPVGVFPESWKTAATIMEGLVVGSGYDSVIANNRLATAIISGKAAAIAQDLPTMNGNALDPVNRALASWLAAHSTAERDPSAGLSLAASAVNDLETLIERLQEPHKQAQLQRILGHARVLLAHVTRSDGRDEAADSLLDGAAEAYAAAAELGDLSARRHYLALASQRDALRGYEAGVLALRWDRLDADAWKAIIGNYGAANAWQRPIHIVAWVLLLGLSLSFALLRGKRGGGNASNSRRPGSAYRRQPTPRAGTPATRPASGTRRPPSSSANRRPSSTAPADASKQGPAARAINDTLMPETMAPRTAPLEKGKAGYRRSPSRQQQVSHETLLPQEQQLDAEQRRRRDRALDANRKRNRD